MSGFWSRNYLARLAPLIVLVALTLTFGAINPHFITVRNIARICVSASPALMVALGVTFVIIMGSIDLSMEGTVAVTAVVFAISFLALGGTVASAGWVAIPLAILVGSALGFINGVLHVRLKIPSFMASLAMGFVGTGLALAITGGNRVMVNDPIFSDLVTERFFKFPMMVYVSGLFVMIAWFIQTRTIIGRNFYAIGGGEELAHASGLNVGRVRIIGFTLAGAFYAIGALFAVSRIGIAEADTGNNFMFVSITSVVVGGTALWGGSGGVWNTLIGVLIVNVINNGMVVVGLPFYLQAGILGLLVIAAVVLSTDRKMTIFVK